MRSKKIWINVIFAVVLLAAAGILFWMNSGRSTGRRGRTHLRGR